MNTIYRQLNRPLTQAALTFFLVVLIGGACSTKTNESGTVEAAKNTAPTESKDEETAEVLKLIEKAPDSPMGYTQLAAIYIKRARATGDFSLNTKAETAIDKALQFAPEDTPARKLKASLHLTFHRFTEALELGKKLQTEFPDDAFVYGVLTDANAELGNYKEAVEAAQKMVDLKPNSNSYARVAHLRSLYGDTEGAVEMFKTAARTADPADKEAQSWCLVQLGDELWKNGKYAEAEKVYDEALQNFPNFHLALAGKGRARAAQNDFEAAVKFLSDALNRVPNVETAILLGDIYTKQGSIDKAKEQYDLVEVIEQKIGVNNDQKRLALLWADHDLRIDEALTIAKRESEMRKDIFTADAFAWTLYKKGQLTDAKTAISAALNPKANDARIYYHAGMIEKDLGNRAEAKKMLETALKINPMFDLIQAENARKALAGLK
ncbi:MAG TPA: tetratricopeptide repeat protein [Pyrinomonadaceae bacterium]|nr:tetratricopeptide repeat protein [Pyrinomonadaceae bacterium]